MTNVSIHSPDAVLTLLVTHAKNFVDEGLGRLFCIWLGRDEVIKEAIHLLKDARARKLNYSQEYEAYSVLIDFLRRHLTNQES